MGYEAPIENFEKNSIHRSVVSVNLGGVKNTFLNFEHYRSQKRNNRTKTTVYSNFKTAKSILVLFFGPNPYTEDWRGSGTYKMIQLSTTKMGLLEAILTSHIPLSVDHHRGRGDQLSAVSTTTFFFWLRTALTGRFHRFQWVVRGRLNIWFKTTIWVANPGRGGVLLIWSHTHLQCDFRLSYYWGKTEKEATYIPGGGYISYDTLPSLNYGCVEKHHCVQECGAESTFHLEQSAFELYNCTSFFCKTSTWTSTSPHLSRSIISTLIYPCHNNFNASHSPHETGKREHVGNTI